MKSFEQLPKKYFGSILADPPWQFKTWGDQTNATTDVNRYYPTMSINDIAAMNVMSLAADDCVLFLWITWPIMPQALYVIDQWKFIYKTCAFCWTKADASQMDLLRDDITPRMGNGYWTRSNSEICLLATRGKPKRLHTDVRQAIIEPVRQHSRKPELIYARIERLVSGPYLELFARQERKNWFAWGNETNLFKERGKNV